MAEGVETKPQADRLLELGYHLAQGFYFARPMPPADVAAMCTAEADVTDRGPGTGHARSRVLGG